MASFIYPGVPEKAAYKIDAGHTAVTIQVKRFGVVNVMGRFGDVDGTVTYDPENINSLAADVTIKVDSYSANNGGGEDAVKSPAFLDAAKYPEIKFKVKSASVKGGRNVVTADLTIHGVTKEVEFPFEVTGPKLDLPTRKQSIGIEGSLTINRQDYGIAFNRQLPTGDAIVGNEVKIDLLVLAIQE